MKILITGGHMVPALAVIRALPKDAKIVYAGRRHAFEGDIDTSLEHTTITKMGLEFIGLSTGRIQRRFTKHTMASLLKIPTGFTQATKILLREKPDVVVGFGGYISVPLCLAGYFLKIPILIHEQTMQAGAANKFLAKIATTICIAWDSSREFFPKEKTVLTGNPILENSKENITKLLPNSNEKLPLLVVVGGSGGSHALNVIIEKSLPGLLEKYRVIHQVGDAREFGDYDRLSSEVDHLRQDLQRRYSLVKFIDPVVSSSVFSAADLVISRSGINTTTQLFLLSKKAILIPLPYGQKNEQLINARFLASKRHAAILLQENATTNELFRLIEKLLQTPVAGLSAQDHRLIDLHKHAAKHIAGEILLCTKKQYQKESGSLS